jgi:protein-tyrosine phosphatase
MSKLPCFRAYDGHFVSPTLAIGGRPTPQDVQDIANTGIRGIINVVAICQRQDLAYLHHLPQDIAWLHLAFWDGVLPQECVVETLSEAYARFIVQRAAVMYRDHGPLLIHCMGGRGRSANLAAVLLAADQQLEPDQAMARIRQYRPKVADFAHQGFWRDIGTQTTIDLARQVLAEPHTPAETIGCRVRASATVVTRPHPNPQPAPEPIRPDQ